MRVPPELPVTPIPPQTEVEPAPRPLTDDILSDAAARAEKAAESEDRIEFSPEARTFDATRALVRDTLSADTVDPDEVADRAYRSITEALYPAFTAERGRSPEAVEAFAAEVVRGVERGAEESRGRPRPEGAEFEPQRERAVERLQQSLVSFVEAERLVGETGTNPTTA